MARVNARAARGSALDTLALARAIACGDLNVSPAEAVRWFRAAAELGDDQAQVNLGLAYARGAGARRDRALANQWYRRAASLGNSVAMYNLGIVYLDGLGVRRDPRRAVQWLTRAAQAGDAGAAGLLGDCLRDGRRRPRRPPPRTGLPRDRREGR